MIAVRDNRTNELIVEVETEDAGWELIHDYGAEGNWEVTLQ